MTQGKRALKDGSDGAENVLLVMLDVSGFHFQFNLFCAHEMNPE